ncbi:MAG: DUF3558 domain-containing protein [Actinomycetota bacterium]|nr:DUF3558 domain-containing protein [Actinomycetota bacterium]
MIAVGSVILLAGCGAGTNPPPDAVQASPTQAMGPIPPVKNPRDVATMLRRPCDLLTAQQVTEFELDLPPKQLDGLLGTLRCKWTSTTRDQQIVRTVDVSMFTDNLTLEAVYNRRQSFPFFELMEIAGYPAIVTRTNSDIPSCNIDIKPAEQQSVSVSYEAKEFNNNPQQSCEVAKQVAAAVVLNVPLKS